MRFKWDKMGWYMEVTRVTGDFSGDGQEWWIVMNS